MGYLLNILLAVGTIALAESVEPHGHPVPAAVALLLPVPYFMARLAAKGLATGRTRRALRIERLMALSPPTLQLIATSLFGWHDAVLAWTGAGTALMAWPHPALLISLLPFVGYQLAAIDASARLFGNIGSDAARHRRFQVRMFASGIAPLIAYVLLNWPIRANEVLRVHVEEVGLYNAALALLVLAAFAWFLPWLLRLTWLTAPLEEGEARRVLEDVAARAGFRHRGLFVWRTGYLMVNAAILGFSPRNRVVLFSDALLAQLDRRQLAAVFAHEVGHARRHHVLVFGAWTLGFFLLVDVLISQLDAGEETLALVILVVLGGLFLLGFSYLSRRFELDADLESLALTGDFPALASALERAGGAHARRKTGQRHFSVADRILFARAASRDPGVGRRLRRSLRRLSLTGVAVFAIALVLEAWQLSERLESDRTIADLRLGRYESAVERVREGGDFSDGLIAVVERAGATPGAETPEDRVGRARAELAGGDADTALLDLELARLRGATDLDGVIDTLELWAEDAEAGARAAAELSPEWRALLLPNG